MIRLSLTLAFALSLSLIAFSQANEKEEDRSLNNEWKEAMEEVESTLNDIEIPDIDVDHIMAEVRKAMPTRDEMNSYKEIIRKAVTEVKKIDLSELEEALNELGHELEDIFHERQAPKNKEKKKEE
ncbi:MAG: hypothetical protein IPL46_28610 [Saprospiraceae bacterium]|nr:hypothetical protein [Saprospiraceae bacterium]